MDHKHEVRESDSGSGKKLTDYQKGEMVFDRLMAYVNSHYKKSDYHGGLEDMHNPAALIGMPRAYAIEQLPKWYLGSLKNQLDGKDEEHLRVFLTQALEEMRKKRISTLARVLTHSTRSDIEELRWKVLNYRYIKTIDSFYRSSLSSPIRSELKALGEIEEPVTEEDLDTVAYYIRELPSTPPEQYKAELEKAKNARVKSIYNFVSGIGYDARHYREAILNRNPKYYDQGIAAHKLSEVADQLRYHGINRVTEDEWEAVAQLIKKGN